jgi:hypothetical protein
LLRLWTERPIWRVKETFSETYPLVNIQKTMENHNF